MAGNASAMTIIFQTLAAAKADDVLELERVKKIQLAIDAADSTRAYLVLSQRPRPRRSA